MKEKNNKNINFDDKYEKIIAAMQERERSEFVDIVSDSSRASSSTRSAGRYKKKEKGFKAWWKRLTKGKKAALISVTSIFLVIALFLVWFFTYFNYNYNSITTDPDELGFSGIKQKGVINVALFGVDSRDETVFTGNTDSIMILSLNTKTKKVKIFSIMRDTFVPMEYNGKDYFGKINSAYSKGPEHAIKTLNQIFDLDISEYATVNFFGMADIIDAVGGIPATITEDELKWKGAGHPNLNNCMDEICNEMGLNAKDYYIKSAGEQTLNGIQAVAYARVRHCTSVWGTRDDYGRTDRQRHVMQGLFNKAITMNKARYVTLAKALIPCSETSLSYSDILSLAVSVLLHSPSFEQYRLPQIEFNMPFSGSSRYGSVVYYDLDYAAKLINGVIYDDVTMEEFIEQNPIEKNDWYAKMASGDTGRRPSGGGTTQNSTPQNTVTSENETTSSETEEDVCTHENTVTKNKKEATETAEGYSGDLYCADCEQLLEPGVKIEKLTPTTPSEPTDPIEPTEPTEPTDPTEPTTPTDPPEGGETPPETTE